MPPLRRVSSCSPSASARTVTAHSLNATGMVVAERFRTPGCLVGVPRTMSAPQSPAASGKSRFLRPIVRAVSQKFQILIGESVSCTAAVDGPFDGASGFRGSVRAAVPPPPGVSIRRRSPGSQPSLAPWRAARSAALPARISRLRPGAPAPPPAAPRRSDPAALGRAARTPSARAPRSRARPRRRPRGARRRRSRGAASTRSTRSGNSSSSASIGVLSVLLIATCTAEGPSASGQAPWPPPIVS